MGGILVESDEQWACRDTCVRTERQEEGEAPPHQSAAIQLGAKRGSKTHLAPGTVMYAQQQPGKATCLCSSGCAPRIHLAPGTAMYARQQLVAATCPCFSGRGSRTHLAPGTRQSVLDWQDCMANYP